MMSMSSTQRAVTAVSASTGLTVRVPVDHVSTLYAVPIMTNELKLSGVATTSTSGKATLSIRYGIAPQYLAGAVALVERARALETPPLLANSVEYMALVVGSIMQAAASIEAALVEACQHGIPGHASYGNPGSLAAVIFSQSKSLGGVPVPRVRSPIDKWNEVLVKLGVPQLDLGIGPGQEAARSGDWHVSDNNGASI